MPRRTSQGYGRFVRPPRREPQDHATSGLVRNHQLRARERAGEGVHGRARSRCALQSARQEDGARIRYEKVSAKSGREVDADDIEMGFEITEGRHVTFDKKELDARRPKTITPRS